jgi:hypothetical protein
MSTRDGTRTGPAQWSDDELIERARDHPKTGPRFYRLFVQGDRAGYGTPSDADMALMNDLAFWTDSDPGRMERLFRASALYREAKEKRSKKYILITIGNVLKDKGQTYSTTRVGASPPRNDAPHATPDRNGPPQEQSGAAPPPAWVPACSWPEPPKAAAFSGLAGDVVKKIEPQTEADPVALLVTILVLFGNAAGRHCYMKVEATRHYPNLFANLVGRTSKSRKGTSLAWGWELFDGADAKWLDDCLQTGLSSGEGLVYAVRDAKWKTEDGETVLVHEGAKDKRLMVVEEEFASVLQQCKREGNVLASVLRQAWDCRKLSTLTRHNPLKATDAHIGLLGHITGADLACHLRDTEIRNGVANRFLWFCARRSKSLPRGGKSLNLKPYQARLQRALEDARKSREVEWSPAAILLWDEKYPKLSEEVPGVLGEATGRAEAQVLRLSLVYALLDRSQSVEVRHLEAALALWDYSLRSCHWVFGDDAHQGDADVIRKALHDAGDGGMTQKAIGDLFNQHKSAKEIAAAIKQLSDFGLIETGELKTGGRPATLYRIPPGHAPTTPKGGVRTP